MLSMRYNVYLSKEMIEKGTWVPQEGHSNWILKIDF
jgi:hypothetical protein